MIKKILLTFTQLIPVIISILMIGAHFYKGRNLIFVIVCLIILFILFVRHPLSARIVQLALILAAIEWIRTTFGYAFARAEIGLPWIRLAIILGFVSCFTFGSAFVFFTKNLKERYKI